MNKMTKKIGVIFGLVMLSFMPFMTAAMAEQNNVGYGYGYNAQAFLPSPEDLLINEFQSRPVTGEKEWVEIWNRTDHPVQLEECELHDARGRIFQFNPVVLSSKAFLIAEISSSKLNNGGDRIELRCGQTLINRIEYGDHSLGERYRSGAGYEEELGYLPAPAVGKSLARFPDGSQTWFVFGQATPGQANLVDNHSPQAIISLQGTKKTEACEKLSFNVTGENSTDPDQDQLSFFWEYRNAVTGQMLHENNRENPLSFTFTETMGEVFTISLRVSDPFGGTAQAQVEARVDACVSQKNPSIDHQLSSNISINELFPNPYGKDGGVEFIELSNTGERPVRLNGWKLGGKTKKRLDDFVIQPKSFLVIHKVTLRNSGDLIELIDPRGLTLSSIEYTGVEEGKSYSRHDSGLFRWTIPTPGRVNDFPFQTETIYLQGAAEVIITRFLPNPKGKDEGREWIEILNRSGQEIDLSGWQLDNREGGSRPYFFTAGEEKHPHLQGGKTLQLFSSQTGITLRNTADQVRLLDAHGNLIDQLEWFTPAPDGKIFSREQMLRDLSIEPDEAVVVQVIDGDTIDVQINGMIERVRLIGVDTPETVHPFKPLEHFGKEASNYSKSQLEGKLVRLEYDLTKRGKYGRLLAYVFVEELAMSPNGESGSWRHFNAELVAKGYAFAYLKYPFQYREQFRQLEQQARKAELGLWHSDQIQLIREEQEQVVDEELDELESIEEALEELEEEMELEEDESTSSEITYDQKGWDQIKLNEILPNPAGKDSAGAVPAGRQGEYIELINLSSSPVDLSGWSILNSKAKTIFHFNPGEDSSITSLKVLRSLKHNLKNSTETLQLIDPLGNIRDEFKYDQKITDNQVWSRNPLTQRWQLLPSGTPGQKNQIILFAPGNDDDNDGLHNDDESFFSFSSEMWDSDGNGLPDDFELLASHDLAQDYTQYLSEALTFDLKQSKRTLSFFGSSRPYTVVELRILPEKHSVTIPVEPDGSWSYKVEFGLEAGGHRAFVRAIDPKGLHSFESSPFDFSLPNRINSSKLPKKKRKRKAAGPKPLYRIQEKAEQWWEGIISRWDPDNESLALADGQQFILLSTGTKSLEKLFLQRGQLIHYRLESDQRTVKSLTLVPHAFAKDKRRPHQNQEPLFLLMLLIFMFGLYYILGKKFFN